MQPRVQVGGEGKYIGRVRKFPDVELSLEATNVATSVTCVCFCPDF